MPAFSIASRTNLRKDVRKSLPTQFCRRTPVSSISERVANASIASPLHPVLQILMDRFRTGSKPGQRKDQRKVALCIEGGGMRGAVSAGMAAAIKYIGLENAFDVVYGSSAGAIVGAYFVSRQVPIYGAQIYYDTICSTPENGQPFIDLWALRHHPYLRFSGRKEKQFYTKEARPVLLLDRLIDDVMRHQKPLDWAAFQKTHAVQPLKPVASSLLQMRSQTLDDFTTFDDFLECLRASARVPGIAGNPVEINGDLYADGLMFEPIPYRSAVEDGCTDVLVLRTRQNVVGKKTLKPGIYENHIAKPYFAMQPKSDFCLKASDYLLAGGHISVYLDDVLRLSTENKKPRSVCDAAIFSVTPAPHAPKIGQLEGRARVVYGGVRCGFAAAYDTLSPFAERTPDKPNPRYEQKGKEKVTKRDSAGDQAAKWVFPDYELAVVEAKHKALREKAASRSREKTRATRMRKRNQKKRIKERRLAAQRKEDGVTELASTKTCANDEISIEEHYFVG